MQIKNKIIILSFVLFAFSVSFALAETTPSIPEQIPDLEEQIDLTLSPSLPKPNQIVTITLEAYGTDLDLATISWKENGKVSEEGVGIKRHTVQAGVAGSSKTINIDIVLPSGQKISKSVVISPGQVDVMWESNTYTPPFYKGKSLYAPQENVRIVAMPLEVGSSGSFVATKNTVYTWRQEGTVLGDKSGANAQTLSYRGNILMKPTEISVDTVTSSESEASYTLRLSPVFPSLGLYEESPLYGTLFNNEVSSRFSFGGATEKTIKAIPYFVGVKSPINVDLAYIWSINGTAIDIPQNQNEVVFRNTKSEEGESLVGVSLSNKSNFLEEASSLTTIKFEKPKKNPLLN